jgi:hypothetical protein
MMRSAEIWASGAGQICYNDESWNPHSSAPPRQVIDDAFARSMGKTQRLFQYTYHMNLLVR